MSASGHAGFLAAIDWERPWLAHLRATGEEIAQAPDWRAAINHQASQRAIHNHQALPIQFVPQAALPAGMAYEAFISASGQVPTRDNLHDFFNALVWLTFPLIKARLNALQATEIARSALQNGGAVRGRLRDAATLFDENAALLITENTELVAALRAHAWSEVFDLQRQRFQQQCSVLLFGHALMEKLVMPYKAITAHMWMSAIDRSSFASMTIQDQCRLIDAQVAAQLGSGFASRDFSPLPVLGIPGWWAGQDQEFYSDTAVFRPRRSG